MNFRHKGRGLKVSRYKVLQKTRQPLSKVGLNEKDRHFAAESPDTG